MVDFHTHVLPGMDDGAKDIHVSLALIEELKSQGVEKIVCTSHFYPYDESMDRYMQRRDEAFRELTQARKGEQVPEIITGAEVYCHGMLDYISDFSGLCIDETAVILLELPSGNAVSPEVIRLIRKLYNRFSLIPVIAHIERYPDMRFGVVRKAKKLKKEGCFIQINASSVFRKDYYPMIRKLMKEGLVDVLGSDCHNMDSRPPMLSKAREKLISDFGIEPVKKMEENAYRLLRHSAAGKDMSDGRVFF